MQVLAVRQVRAEGEDEHDVRPAHDPVARLGEVRTDPLERHAQRSRQHGPRPRGIVGLDHVREGVADPLGQDDEEDEPQDDEGVMRQRQARRPDDGAPDHVVDDRCQYQSHEDVGEECDDAPREAAERPLEDRLHQPVGQVVAGRGQQDDEAPEHEGVGQARTEVLQQPLLPEDEDAQALDPLPGPIRSVQVASEAQKPDVLPAAAPEGVDRQCDGHDDERIERNRGFHAWPPW